MKKIICILLIFFNMSLINVDAFSRTVRLQTDKETTQNNEKFTLSFYIDEVEDAYGIKLYICYDDTYLMPLQKTLNIDEQTLTKDVFIVRNSAGHGEIELVGTFLGKGQKIRINKIFYIPFKALKKGKTTIKIDTLKVLNEHGEKLKVNIVNKEIIIHENIEENKKHDATKNSTGSKSGYVNSKDDNVDNIKIQYIDIHNLEEYDDKILKLYNLMTRDEVLVAFVKLVNIRSNNYFITSIEMVKALYQILEFMDKQLEKAIFSKHIQQTLIF